MSNEFLAVIFIGVTVYHFYCAVLAKKKEEFYTHYILFLANVMLVAVLLKIEV